MLALFLCCAPVLMCCPRPLTTRSPTHQQIPPKGIDWELSYCAEHESKWHSIVAPKEYDNIVIGKLVAGGWVRGRVLLAEIQVCVTGDMHTFFGQPGQEGGCGVPLCSSLSTLTAACFHLLPSPTHSCRPHSFHPHSFYPHSSHPPPLLSTPQAPATRSSAAQGWQAPSHGLAPQSGGPGHPQRGLRLQAQRQPLNPISRAGQQGQQGAARRRRRIGMLRLQS